MPSVFVHGVPETPRIWDPLFSHLERSDTIASQLPGFGTPRPEGFGATMDDYADWLVHELQGIGEPVDLVGHDWGGGFVLRVVSTRPDLIRTWVTDAASMADVDFEWHDFAKLWQTPGEGEAFWEGNLALDPEGRAQVMEAVGVPEGDAVELASALDTTMVGCILDLYRSATKVNERWGPEFVDIPRPGMVIIPTADLFLRELSAPVGGQGG